MVIAIAGAIFLLLHQFRRRVEDDLGRHQRARLLGPLRCTFEGRIDGIRLRRGRHIHDSLRNGQFTLGTAEEIIGVLGGQRLDQRLRIGKAHVLNCHAHDAPDDEQRVLPRHQHPGEIVKSRIRIRTAHRFMQGRNEIVMPVGRLVVERHALLDGAREQFR